MSFSTDMTENNCFFEVKGWKVSFEKIGSGPNPVLLIPGEIGTARIDFEELLEGEDGLDFNKFTVVSVEAPGWGTSRPPLRRYDSNVYQNDSHCFHEIMRSLGFEKYSIIGFSEGAKVALLMAITYPQSITSLVLSSLKIYTSNKGLSALLSDKSVEKWRKDRLNSYLKVYETKEELQKIWNRFLKFAEFYNQYFPEDIFKNQYKKVECPVLLTHGDKDPMIESEQPLYVREQLNNAYLHRFPKGDHYCHRKYSSQYLKLVQDHILNPCNYKPEIIFEKWWK